MRKTVRRIFTLGMAASLVLTLMIPGASAASVPEGIRVQLNGEELVFTDVSPFAENGRTYVPFRALFEELGAAVDYDDETMTVTAVRGDTTVSFVIGQSEVTVTEGVLSETISIDAPAIARNNRTLVPVRFAAQALGCNVGWDQDDRTVIVDDVDAILAANAATYTVMDKYLAFSRGFTAIPHSITGKMSLAVSFQEPDSGSVSIEIDGSMNGLVHQDGMELKMLITTNFLELLQQNSEGQEIDAQTLLMASMLDTIEIEYLMNLDTGMMYIRMDKLNQLLELEEGTWISVDLNAVWDELLVQSGTQVSLPALISMSTSTESYREYLSVLLKELPLTDKDNSTVTVLELLNAMYSDQAMVNVGNGYVSTVTEEVDGFKMSMVSTFSIAGGVFTGYSMAVSAVMEEALSMEMTTGMNADGKTTVSATMTVPSAMELVINGTIEYAETSAEPAPQPADGSVISIQDLGLL